MANTVNLNVRVDENLKRKAEKIYNELGMNLTTALNLFLRSSIRYGGIPFDLRLDQDYRINEEMKADILSKVAESESAIAAGNTREAYEALSELRAKYGL